MKIAVIGIGQSLRGDDAAGLDAIRQWQAKYPETANRSEVRVDASELPGLALIDLLDGMDAAVIVDAVKSSAKPGTIHRISPNELSAFTPDTQSAHGWGVAETLQLGCGLYPTLKNLPVRLIGIEAEQVSMGAGLSQIVAQAMPELCHTIEDEVQTFLKQ
ncbi:MAG: hydrogenase maturation protease [Anaerolineales bacterium]